MTSDRDAHLISIDKEAAFCFFLKEKDLPEDVRMATLVVVGVVVDDIKGLWIVRLAKSERPRSCD